MGIRVAGMLEPANPKNPVAKAEHIEMPDGSRLSDFNPVYPVKAAQSGAVLEPETFYQFGEVSELAVTLAQKEDGKAHEYWFDFEPAEGFAGLTITPEPRWMVDPQYPVGKRCLVGIVMGMAVMGIV